jgi:hypothetical protein
MIRVTFDDKPADPQPPPTWQPDLFRPMCARSIAEQRELFPALQEPERKPPAPAPDAARQGRLFD